VPHLALSWPSAAILAVSRSRWRWTAAAYPALTTLVVVVTANHFWMDGIAAAGVLAAALVAQRVARSVRGRIVLRVRFARPGRPGLHGGPSRSSC
jgi:hypothetical protein